MFLLPFHPSPLGEGGPKGRVRGLHGMRMKKKAYRAAQIIPRLMIVRASAT